MFNKKQPAFILCVRLLLILSGCGLFSAEVTPIPTTGVTEQVVEETDAEPLLLFWDNPPEMTIDTSQYYLATLRTAKGEIKIELFADRAPITVNNFVFLAESGYYDNTTFHRVIPDFMAQGGDPTATGAGGPGYAFDETNQ